MNIAASAHASIEGPDILAGGGEMGALIRAHEWAASPLGPPSAWPAELRNALGMILQSPFPMAIAWGPDFRQFYNDAFRPFLGSTSYPAPGQPLRETAPRLWTLLSPMLATASARGSASADVTDDGTSVRFSASAIAGADGRTAGLAISALDLTPAARTDQRELEQLRRQVSEAIDESERRLTFALNAARVGFWEFNLRTWKLSNSDIYRANWGRRPDEPFDYADLLESIQPQDRPEHERQVREAIATGAPLDIEYRAIWPDNSVHWLRVRGRAIHDEHGRALSMAGISLDITDRKAIEESLRLETRKLERLNETGTAMAGDLDIHRIVQTVTDAATELSGAQFGAFFYNLINEKGESYTLYTLSGVPREAFAKFPMPRNTAIFEPTFRGTRVMRSDNIQADPRYGKSGPHFGMPKGHLPVKSYLAVPVTARSGEVLGGLFFGHEGEAVFTEREERIVCGIAAQAAIAIDNARLFQAAQAEIADRRRAEEQMKLLLAELNHRVKNTLAIVQSIAGQTLRHSDSAETFRTGFEARIMALSSAHDLLTESNWEGASLRGMLNRVLMPYSDHAIGRHALDGAEVSVDPKTSVSLVLAFHELATNAAKYGALSNATGHVHVKWNLVDGPDGPVLHLSWTEYGGPTVRQPSHRGFGSRLIGNLARESGGELSVDFASSGLICNFVIPLSTGNFQ